MSFPHSHTLPDADVVFCPLRNWYIAEAVPLDREAFNAALRALFKAVVVNYPQGELMFEWIAGRSSEVMYTFAVDEG